MSIKDKLFASTPIYSLVVIRILFGLLILWECYDEIASNVIFESFIEPKFHFKYYGFAWVKALPGRGMYWFFCLLAALAIFVTLGLFYRFSIILFTIGFTYAFLIDQTSYLNHYYMIILFGILLSFMPAHRYFSFDAYFNPQIKAEKIPFWPIFLLRAQTEIILLFAGFVKINYDWLVRLEPLRFWLGKADAIAPLHYLFTQDWAIMVAAWGVVTLHVVGAPLLLWRRTHIYVFFIYCCFHTLNDYVFQIGSFPWMTIALTTIFFAPDWPKKIFKLFDKNESFSEVFSSRKNLAVVLMSLWIVAQILVPLRHFLYPGHVSWNAEGQRFAWRMKLNTMNGMTRFFVTDFATNQTWPINNAEYLTFAQHSEMQCQPDVMLQFAHHLHKVWVEEKGHKDVGVYVYSFCALNRREPKPFTNAKVDLAKVERSLKHNDWVTEFDHNWQ